MTRHHSYARDLADHRAGRRHSKTSLLIMLAIAACLAGPALGQQSRTVDAANAKVAPKKAKGRLPAYFSSLVSQKQREAIYKVQGEYEAQLEKLKAQIEALIVERDREIDAVLDADQLAEITKKRDAAKKKRDARNAARLNSKEKAES